MSRVSFGMNFESLIVNRYIIILTLFILILIGLDLTLLVFHKSSNKFYWITSIQY